MAYYRRSYKKRAATKKYRKRTYKRTVYKRRYVRSYPKYGRKRPYYKKPRSKVLGASALKCYRKFGDASKCQALEARAVVSHQRKAMAYDKKKPVAIATGSIRVSTQLARLQASLSGDVNMNESLKRSRDDISFNGTS